MYIFDLDYLEDQTRICNIKGGNCSLSVQSVNGETIVKSSGRPVQTEVKTQGGITTTTYSVAGCPTQISISNSTQTLPPTTSVTSVITTSK